MKISDILSKKRALSFEVFPPKKGAEEIPELLETVSRLKELGPDFISVTYGAGGTNAREATAVSGHIKAMGVEPLAHITGGPSSPSDVERVVKELSDYGVENVLALRGDRPNGFSEEYCKYFPHATDLLEFLGDRFCLGAACYPEGHTECETLREDIVNLRKKQDAGAKFLITQRKKHRENKNDVRLDYTARLQKHDRELLEKPACDARDRDKLRGVSDHRPHREGRARHSPLYNEPRRHRRGDMREA